MGVPGVEGQGSGRGRLSFKRERAQSGPTCPAQARLPDCFTDTSNKCFRPGERQPNISLALQSELVSADIPDFGGQLLRPAYAPAGAGSLSAKPL